MRPWVPQISEVKMKRIVADLSSRDIPLAKVIAENELCTIGRNLKPISNFESLVKSVISQQLSVNAANTIYGRVKNLAGGRVNPTRIANVSESLMRTAGVSAAKYRSIQGLASACLNNQIKVNKLHEERSDEKIFSQLSSLWGIGPWTIDMFMIFQLGRLDIWPTGDLGVRRGWETIYKLPNKITPAELEKKGEKFRPYRSVVGWYCWRAWS